MDPISATDQSRASGVRGIVRDGPSQRSNAVTVERSMTLTLRGANTLNHIGIRISEKSRSVAVYEHFGFQLVHDNDFDRGCPIIMQHSCGVVLNLLGPGTSSAGKNILMGVDDRKPRCDSAIIGRRNMNEIIMANSGVIGPKAAEHLTYFV